MTAANTQTRGERNNNPGNIDCASPRAGWLGAVPDDQLTDPRFEQFSAPVYGIRALAKLLHNYQSMHGLRTVTQIIGRWAPGTENNTAAYVRAVCGWTGWPADRDLDLSDIATLAQLARAIIRQENGRCRYTNDMLALAARIAIDAKPAQAVAAMTPTPSPLSRGGGVSAADALNATELQTIEPVPAGDAGSTET